MPRIPFEHLPDDARLWVFPASRPLGPREAEDVLGAVDRFLETWSAHGAPLTAGRDLRYGCFLLVAVDERAAGVSGCSIDALTRGLREIERRLGVSLLDHGPVWYREGDVVRRASREEFRALVQAGAVTPDTVVFDHTVATIGALRSGAWETSAGRSWHGRAFFGRTGRPTGARGSGLDFTAS